jgi:TP901 family phage tail tape measure protein
MAGEQMFLGVRLQLDATGVVTGAALAGNSIDRVNTRINQTGRAFNRTANDMMSASLRVAGALGTLAMAASRAGTIVANHFIKPSLEEAKSFETEMSMLKFVTKGTAEEMKNLQGVALQTGLATQFSPQEAASGIRMLKAAGLETDLALQSLNATLDITTGSAGALGLKDAATATAAALLKFRGTGESARKIMDVFAQSTRETNMQMGDLAGIIDAMRDAPAKLNMTAVEALALAGVMRSAGLSTRAAGLNVSMFAERLILAQRRVSRYLRKARITEEQLFDPTYFDKKMPDVSFQFKRLGVHLFDTNNKLKKATTLIKELADRAMSLKEESQKAFLETISSILGPRSSAVLMALVNFKKGGEQGAAAFQNLVDTLKDSAGASREAAAAIELTTTGMEKFIEGSIQTIRTIQGTALLPILKDFHLGLRKILNTFLAFLENHPDFTKALGATAIAFYVLSKTLAVLAGGLALATAWAYLIGPALMSGGVAAQVMAAGITVLKIAMIGLGYVALGVLGIFVLFQAAFWVWKKIWSKDARGIFLNLQIFFRSIKLVWQGLVSLIKKGELSDALYEQLETAGLIGFVVALYQMKTRLVEVWEGIKTGFIDAMGPILWVLDKVGRAIGWIIDIFSRMMTEFTGTNMHEAAAAWHTLGYVIGMLAAIWMTKLIVVSAIWLFKQLPLMLYKLAVLSFRFLLLGFRVLWFAGVAMWSLIKQSAVLIARFTVLILKVTIFAAVALVKGTVALAGLTAGFIAANAAALLLVGKLLLIVAVAGFAIWFLLKYKIGEKFGVWLSEAVEKSIIGLFNLWTAFKKWGGKIAEVFVEAFKGNFDPFFEYLTNAWELAKKIWGWITSDVTDEEVKQAAAKLGIVEVTEKERRANVAGARALMSGQDVGVAMERAGGGTAERVSARIARSNEAARQYNALLQALKQQGRTVHIDKIELATKGKSNQEALRLAKDMMAQVARVEDNAAEVEFSQ